MAAPHVSGAIAAFLSIRREFIGEAESVKKIFASAATDLGRSRYFQGSGLAASLPVRVPTTVSLLIASFGSLTSRPMALLFATVAVTASDQLLSFD
jgi:hypothetical protein